MPALTFHADKIDISLTYDGFTMYPDSQSIVSKPYIMMSGLFMFMVSCQDLNYLKNLSKSCEDISKSFHNFHRTIHQGDPDHMLYHADGYDRDRNHYHLKFQRLINRDQIKEIIDVAVNNNLLTTGEKDEFMQAYDARYAASRKSLDDAIKGNNDYKAIIQHIHTIPDNDVLSDLHTYLASDKFNYLRNLHSKNANAANCWQGVDKNNAVGPSSFEWAMIEKALTCKIASNIRSLSTLTSELGLEKSSQLAQDLKFFAIKRKSTASRTQNNVYRALEQADRAELDTHCEKNFRAFSS